MTTLMLCAVILLAASLVACAVLDHADALRTLSWQRDVIAAARVYIDDGIWRGIAEQVAADALGEPIDINAFSSMAAGRVSWLRFVLRDGRALVFATARRVPECHGRGRRLNLSRHACAIGELQALWAYFGRETGLPHAIPRHCTWYVLPLQSPQLRLLHPAHIQLAAPMRRSIHQQFRLRIFGRGITQKHTEF